MKNIRTDPTRRKLLPPPDVRIMLDRNYIMAAAGVLSQIYPEAAKELLLESVGFTC
ncbi:MAG: glutamate mutase L [Deltaproteobacteria bacterium]|nr:glutamate mutase L [Deltaproteobacteria bacterium]